MLACFLAVLLYQAVPIITKSKALQRLWLKACSNLSKIALFCTTSGTILTKIFKDKLYLIRFLKNEHNTSLNK